ncbi:hypothetical protein [Anaerobaca lacustris]|uniref:Uncharacterized protein n=1 Tax=Anaerobaca lacustris TaxID=3044600 RepID=A0AAW6TT59_9BACT|nr:hypothetical protein [Sedimentisphaerales bacterium M17dextr]
MRDRFCPVLEPEFKSCKPPFSFYRFADKQWPDENNRTLHRIFSLMRKMKAQTMVVEKLDRARELDAEAAAAEVRCQASVGFQAYRLGFFSSPVTWETLPYADDTDYLGYAVVLSIGLPDGTSRKYIYEAVIVEPSFQQEDRKTFGTSLPAHYVHCVRRYSAWVAGHRFTLWGSFFAQQNGLTNVCAHVALRSVLNNLPERAERMISCEEINHDLNIDHATRKIGRYGGEAESSGLHPSEICKVIEKHGWKFILSNYEDPVGQPQPYWKFVYSIIESGYPVLVYFTAGQAQHVICVVGHTLNTDVWDAEARLAYSGAPRAEYLSSASWIDHFVIHDDNYGMYLCMPSKALYPTAGGRRPFQVTGAVGIVPTEMELGPLLAEPLASWALRCTTRTDFLQDCYWLHVLRHEDDAFGKWLVLRTLCVGKGCYQQHLQDIEDVQGNALKGNEISVITGSLPEHFWMTEVTLTDVYTANKRKLGEVLFSLSDPAIRTEDSNEEYTSKVFSKCLAIRLPGNVVIPQVESNDQVSLRVWPTDLTGHVPLLRMRSPIPRFEW